jgi:hypothetical protein
MKGYKLRHTLNLYDLSFALEIIAKFFGNLFCCA